MVAFSSARGGVAEQVLARRPLLRFAQPRREGGVAGIRLHGEAGIGEGVIMPDDDPRGIRQFLDAGERTIQRIVVTAEDPAAVPSRRARHQRRAGHPHRSDKTI